MRRIGGMPFGALACAAAAALVRAQGAARAILCAAVSILAAAVSAGIAADDSAVLSHTILTVSSACEGAGFSGTLATGGGILVEFESCESAEGGYSRIWSGSSGQPLTEVWIDAALGDITIAIAGRVVDKSWTDAD